MQIVARKRTTERAEDYDALMDKVAALLLAGCQKLGLLQPNGTLPQGGQGNRESIRVDACGVARGPPMGPRAGHASAVGGSNRTDAWTRQRRILA